MGGVATPKLDQRIGWQAPQTADDGAGGLRVTGYADAVDRWAEVKAAPGGEQVIGGAARPVSRVGVVIRSSSDPGVRSTWRGLWRRSSGDLVLEAVSAGIPNVPMIGFTSVECVLVGDPA